MTTTANKQVPAVKDEPVRPTFTFRIGQSVGQTSTINITGTTYASNGSISGSSAIPEYDIGDKSPDYWDVKTRPFSVDVSEKV